MYGVNTDMQFIPETRQISDSGGVWVWVALSTEAEDARLTSIMYNHRTKAEPFKIKQTSCCYLSTVDILMNNVQKTNQLILHVNIVSVREIIVSRSLSLNVDCFQDTQITNN